ncbi:hypothetical protein LEN26_005029 [Aphanomyces euteiches]|nr:hypothetical protein AeMF1_007968 [Aphanomyces euteiches]KAH9144139.1 hypothetical protein LEN26_005029 [Aphanomyces euteiches]KAH9168410.1 hypothetical protein AeNC1_017935 [Aphanomyces euteiches]
MTAAVESKLGLLGLGLAQIAIAYGSVMFYPRYFGPLETNHPTGLAQSVLVVAALTFPLLTVTAPGKTFMSGFQTIALGLAASIVGTLAIHVVIIFFGAPLFQLWWETLLLAALVTILSIPALIMHLPMSFSQVIDLLLNARQDMYRSLRDLQAAWTCIGTLVGAYLGTVFIPLDWDRPWQKWPLPCIYGAVYGHIGGILLSFVITLSGVRLVTSKKD